MINRIPIFVVLPDANSKSRRYLKLVCVKPSPSRARHLLIFHPSTFSPTIPTWLFATPQGSSYPTKGQDGQPKTGRRFYYLALSYGYIQPDMSPEGHQLGPVRPDSKFALLQMQTRHDYRTKGPTLFESINVTNALRRRADPACRRIACATALLVQRQCR